MRLRKSALIAATVTGAVASLGLVAIAPTWIDAAVAGTAAIGWCLYLEREGTNQLVDEASRRVRDTGRRS